MHIHIDIIYYVVFYYTILYCAYYSIVCIYIYIYMYTNVYIYIYIYIYLSRPGWRCAPVASAWRSRLRRQRIIYTSIIVIVTNEIAIYTIIIIIITYIYIYIYIYTHTWMYVYTYIYIYIMTRSERKPTPKIRVVRIRSLSVFGHLVEVVICVGFPGGTACVYVDEQFLHDHKLYVHLLYSENSFAICFLLEVPLRGFPFQMRSFET